MAWCAGFGRLGGIFGPLVGGLILGAGLSSSIAFYIFAGIALLGAGLTVLVPNRHEALATSPSGTRRAAASAMVTVD